MTAVSFGTGALDAATFLGMDEVFGANMTGNVILTAMSVAGEGAHSALGPLMALGGFVSGSWLLGLIVRRHAKSAPVDPLVAPVFAFCAAGMIAVTVILAMLPLAGFVLHAATFSIGVLMGCQAIAARRVGVPDMSTVVITSTLSLLFAEVGTSRGGASSLATSRRLAAVLSMFLGAICGALLLKASLVAALAVPSVILSAVAVVYAIRAVRHARTPALSGS
ncbi:YoaK family protein [Rhodococcus erythropolis]|uniref:YoaK family protein n=1 Tax=Rhodococcus erythropolis TaxID=1833 RepID=UPI001C403D3E|nr:YoaK family protein [Rhodococcus erythropolis]